MPDCLSDFDDVREQYCHYLLPGAVSPRVAAPRHATQCQQHQHFLFFAIDRTQQPPLSTYLRTVMNCEGLPTDPDSTTAAVPNVYQRKPSRKKKICSSRSPPKYKYGTTFSSVSLASARLHGEEATAREYSTHIQQYMPKNEKSHRIRCGVVFVKNTYISKTFPPFTASIRYKSKGFYLLSVANITGYRRNPPLV